MSGDSDNDLLTQDHSGETDPLQATSDELRRLRIAERRRRSSHSFEMAAPKEGLEQVLEADNSPNFPPPPLPPWPTALSQNEPPADAAVTPRSPTARQPMAAPLSAAPPPPTRKRTDPFLRSPDQGTGATSLPPSGTGAHSLPGWAIFRRFSHWLIPGFLVAAFFALALVVNPHLPALSILLIFVAIGLLQAALLLYAPNDAFWAVSLVGGFVALMAVSFFAFFGPIFGLLLSILLLALGVVAVRERYYPVKEGTVVVMGLFGRFNRTLQPGFNLRAPGEKVLGVVETQRLRYEVRLPPITLFSREQVTLSAAITYQVVPGQEYLAIRTAKDWQKPIQQQLIAVVQDVISSLSLDAFQRPAAGQRPSAPGSLMSDEINAEPEASPLERMNDRLTTVMREQVADRGVAVHAVKVHVIEGPRLPASAGSVARVVQVPQPSAGMPGTQQGAGRGIGGAHPGSPTVALPTPQAANIGGGGTLGTGAAPGGWPGQPVLPPHPPGPAIAPPSLGAASPPGVLPPTMTLISAQALAETYDAVVRQRITDLGTIRRIIAQFEAVAADPELSQQVPFDAAAGALNLQHHLYQLEMRSASSHLSPPADDAAPPGVPEDT